MNRKEIMSCLETLSKSQGYYTRIVNMINEMNEEDYNVFMEELESKNFDSTLDIVLYFEDAAHYERTSTHE